MPGFVFRLFSGSHAARVRLKSISHQYGCLRHHQTGQSPLLLRIWLVKIRRARHANVPRVVIGPGQRHGEHRERQNDPGNDDDSFCGHGYASFFGIGLMVIVRSHRSQRWMMRSSSLVACIATWHAGQDFGCAGLGVWFTRWLQNTTYHCPQIRMFT